MARKIGFQLINSYSHVDAVNSRYDGLGKYDFKKIKKHLSKSQKKKGVNNIEYTFFILEEDVLCKSKID